MSAAAWPPCLAPIGRYIARAAEIKDAEPVVAYYCALRVPPLGAAVLYVWRLHAVTTLLAALPAEGPLFRVLARGDVVGPNRMAL